MSEQTGKPKDDLIGQIIGQYEILEEIGRGGMATVYRARQLSINRIVAVKVLPRHLLHDPGFFERFEREVDVVAHLEHPHILPIYDYGKTEGIPYIAMRYLAGGSLAQFIRRGTPRLEDLERPFAQVAQALDYAHRQGIIHRDIKPGNILLDENSNAYLSDFGIARVLGSNLTGSAIIGTPAYMSPEQANGFPLDARSDIYSLGIVLFELITGREPYQAETPMALLLKHINEPVPPISQFRQGTPPAVEHVIARATAKDPNHRFASAGEMAADFSAALRGAPGRPPITGGFPAEDSPTILPDASYTPPPTPYGQPAPTPYGQPTPAPTPYGQPTPAPTPYPTAAPQEPARRRSWLPLAAAVIVLLVLAAAAALALPGLIAPEVPVTQVAQALGTPTPFAGAQVVRAPQYSISIPREWIPPQGYFDRSDDSRLVHVWQDVDLEAYVALILVEADVAAGPAYAQAVARYTDQHYSPQRATHGDLTLIDESTAPDGTIRRSFRMRNAPAPAFPPGQLDVFFLARAPYLAVLELYSADSTGSALVPTFQRVLDSLRLPEESS